MKNTILYSLKISLTIYLLITKEKGLLYRGEAWQTPSQSSEPSCQHRLGQADIMCHWIGCTGVNYGICDSPSMNCIEGLIMRKPWKPQIEEHTTKGLVCSL